MIFSRSKSAFTRRTERGSRMTNSLNTGPVNARRTPGIFFQFRQRELRLGQVLLGHFAQALLAQQAQVHGRRQRAQRLVGADVRGGLFAADVLLARRQRQAESARGLARRWSARPAGRASGARIFRAWR